MSLDSVASAGFVVDVGFKATLRIVVVVVLGLVIVVVVVIMMGPLMITVDGSSSSSSSSSSRNMYTIQIRKWHAQYVAICML